MLVNPILRSEEQVAILTRFYKMHGIDDWEESHESISTGVFYAHLNFDHDLKEFQDIEMYPTFGAFQEWEVTYARRDLEENPDNPWTRERLDAKLAKQARHPTEDLFLKDGWKHLIDKHASEYSYMVKDGIGDVPEFEYSLNSYGVCDTPEQLLAMYDFERDPRRFVISFTPILKKHQSPDGGWRWHKWGPYIGTHTPQYEYLYDEDGIDEVLVYHIHELVDESEEDRIERTTRTEENFARLLRETEAHEAKRN